MDTTEPGERSHDFELWHGVIIAIVGMLAISFTFIGICVKCRRKEGGRYIHQTKPMKRKNGTQGSVFSVRSQGIMELQSPHPNYNLAATGEEGNGRSQEQLQTYQQLHIEEETPANADPGYQQVDAVIGGDVVYDEVDSVRLDDFSRQSAVRQSVRSESGRNIHFARQGNSRASVRSESGISTRVRHQGGDDSRGPGGEGLSHHRPTSMSTRSMVRAQMLHRGSTDPLIGSLNNVARTVDGLDGSNTSLPQVSIHQVTAEATTPGPKPSLSSDDIPGFRDPEILGGSSDSLERLRLDLPPDIYNSQILTTVRSPEWEDMREDEEGADNEEGARGSAFKIVTETSKSTHSLDTGLGARSEDDKIMLVVSGDTLERADGTGDEVLYDLPILQQDNLEPLFDDPGYKRGFIGRTWSAAATPTAHTYHTLEPPGMGGGQVLGVPRAASMARSVQYENITIGSDVGAGSSSAVMAKKLATSYENIVPGRGGDNGIGQARTLPAMEASQGARRVVQYENVVLGEQETNEVGVSSEGDGVGVVSKEGDVGAASKGDDVDGDTHVRHSGERDASEAEGNGVDKEVEVNTGSVGVARQNVGVANKDEDMSKRNASSELMMKGVASNGGVKGSVESLTLLDFEDSELVELDPDIAACLTLESENSPNWGQPHH